VLRDRKSSDENPCNVEKERARIDSILERGAAMPRVAATN
jgi:hypothetical protein